MKEVRKVEEFESSVSVLAEGEHKKTSIELVSLVPVYTRIDGFGRVFFDTCENDHQHLTTPARTREERRTCRFYLNSLFEKVAGQRGYIYFGGDFGNGK